MRANSSDRGFTLVELILVMVMLGVLALVSLPRLDGALAVRDDAWRQQVLSALREAQTVSQAHRRLVCVSIHPQDVTLTIAAGANATGCNQPWLGPDRDSRMAHDDSAPSLSVTPAGKLYFQPTGRITSDGAGATAVSATLAMGGVAPIQVSGETGHLE